VRRAHNQRRVILVLSDGGDNRSRYRETEVRRLLLETPAQVYAVSIAQFFQDDSTAFGPDRSPTSEGSTHPRITPGQARELTTIRVRIAKEKARKP